MGYRVEPEARNRRTAPSPQQQPNRAPPALALRYGIDRLRGIEARRSFSTLPADTAWVWLALIVIWLALCFRLGHLPLIAPDEGRNAEVAREMKESGAWLVPTYDGVDYLDKPAFYFKAVAFSLAAFGNNETAARLPSAVFGVALAVMAFAFCRKIYGTRCGLLAAMVIATTPLFVMNARTVIFDMTLAFFVCGAIFAGGLAEEAEGRARRNWYLLGAASAGFATIVKGPVGFLIPALVLLIFNRVEGRRGAWRRLFAPLNLLVFFAVTLPWFVGLCLAHPDFLHYGLVEETFHRFTSAKTFHRSQPVYFYLLVVAIMFFPWSLLLPEAGLAAWRERWAKNRADRLCLIWSLVTVVFFSFSQSKLPGYILSVTVASGILVARIFDVALANPEGRAARLLGRATLAFALVCLLVAVVVMQLRWQMQILARPLYLTPVEAEQLGRAAMPLAVAFAVFGVFGLVARWRRSAGLSFLCLALFIPLGANAGMGVIGDIFDAYSGWQIARRLPALTAGTELAGLQCFPNGVPFYLRRTVTLISGDGGELTSNYIIYFLKNNPVWPKQIVPLADFDGWLASQKTPVYLIARRSDAKKLEAIAAVRGATVQTLSAGYCGAQLPAPGGP
jgi:4-amino-4-deoxy-L-arabinose transferase-like glycosyltransferase